jgi:hypothetical protein
LYTNTNDSLVDSWRKSIMIIYLSNILYCAYMTYPTVVYRCWWNNESFDSVQIIISEKRRIRRKLETEHINFKVFVRRKKSLMFELDTQITISNKKMNTLAVFMNFMHKTMSCLMKNGTSSMRIFMYTIYVQVCSLGSMLDVNLSMNVFPSENKRNEE